MPLVELGEHAARVLAAIRQAGGRPMLVGGCVRDALIAPGSRAKDIDVEVYGRRHPAKGATADEIRRCISNTIEAVLQGRGELAHYPEGTDGHLPSYVYTWQWGKSTEQFTRVIASTAVPGYIVTAYVNAAKHVVNGGSWIDCAAA